MIVFWLLYSLAISFWLGLVALLLERAQRSFGRSSRFIWAGALVLSVVLPLSSALRAALSPPQVAGVGGSQQVLAALWPALLDRTALLCWLCGSVALLIAIVLAQRALLRERKAWHSAEVQGVPVLISADFGPGVIALGGARIVLPAWALEADSAAQALMVQHENEHLRARDHRLIQLGLLLLVICPFNVVLWWQFSRLKLAIEMDCDARVLAGRRDVRRYAALLLDVGGRTRAGRLVFAAFAAPPHAIERRIRMMLDKKPRTPLLTAGLAGAGAIVLVLLACQTPEPQSPEVPLRQALGLVPDPPPPPPPPPGAEGDYVVVIDEPAQPTEVELVEVSLPPKQDGRLGGSSQGEYVEVVELKPPPPPPPPPGKEGGAKMLLDKVQGGPGHPREPFIEASLKIRQPNR